MTHFKTATLIAASTLLFASTNAFAGEQVKSDDMKADKTAEMSQESETSETAATTSAVVTFTKTSEDPRVLGAIARGDMVKVQDNDGDVYLNRFVPLAELPDPELDVDTVESYTYEYNGRVYTNKVVNEK
ncbi:hypothetical protein [Litorimonas sp.]|uniref:hypothetical protein n=1 Tax=Litorimonas sp. TaxID=1892381 RepID=UPI003A86BB16